MVELEHGYYCPRGVYYRNETFFVPGSMSTCEQMEQFSDKELNIWAGHLYINKKTQEQQAIIDDFLKKQFKPLKGVVQRPRYNWGKDGFQLAEPKLKELDARFERSMALLETYKKRILEKQEVANVKSENDKGGSAVSQVSESSNPSESPTGIS